MHLKSVREPLTPKHFEVLLDANPAIGMILDPKKINYPRGRLTTHKNRFLVWYEDGSCFEIIVMLDSFRIVVTRYVDGDGDMY